MIAAFFNVIFMECFECQFTPLFGTLLVLGSKKDSAECLIDLLGMPPSIHCAVFPFTDAIVD